MPIENGPQPAPAIETAETAQETAEFGKADFVDIELYNDEAKQAMRDLYNIIANNLKIDPANKQKLWEAIEEQVDIEVGTMRNDLNRMAESHIGDLMSELANKQVQVATMIQAMNTNLGAQLQEALDWGVITDDEVDELAANAEMLLPIEVRGLTKAEREALGKQESDLSRMIAEAPNALVRTFSKEGRQETREFYMGPEDLEIPEEDVKAIREALLPETNIDKTVKLLTGQKELEGYQKVLLTPANAIEGVAKGFLNMPETLATLKKMGEDMMHDESLAKMGIDAQIVLRVIDQYFSAAEKVAFVGQFLAEGAIGVGVASMAAKLEKFPQVARIMVTLSKLQKESKALRATTTVGSKLVETATHRTVGRTTALSETGQDEKSEDTDIIIENSNPTEDLST